MSSGMDMDLEEVELADHAALSAMEAMCKNLTLDTPSAERIMIAKEAYRMAKEMVVARRKFIQEHAASDSQDGDLDEEDLDG